MTLIPRETERPIREDVLKRNNRSPGMSADKSGSYLIRNQVCATCGESTRGAYHLEYRRDLSGRLLVKETA